MLSYSKCNDNVKYSYIDFFILKYKIVKYNIVICKIAQTI